MVVREAVETGMALGTAGEEEVVVEGVEAEVAVVVEQGQAVETPQGLHLEREGPVVGWETFPSRPASAHCGDLAG